MDRFRSLILAGLLCLGSYTHAADTNFWIFLCFGQSKLGTRYGLKMLSILGYNTGRAE